MNFSNITTRQALATLGAAFGLVVLAGPAAASVAESSDAFTRYVANHQAHEQQVAQANQSSAFIRYPGNTQPEMKTYHASAAGIPDSVAQAVKNNAANNATATNDVVIPYLSHGEGIVVGEDGLPQSQPSTVVPYLSHGEGVLVGEDGLPKSVTVIPYLSHGIGIEDTTSAVTLRERPDGFQPQLHTIDTTSVTVDDGFDWETTGFVSGGLLAALALALMTTIALRHRDGLKSA